ncbi:hypothetical protein BDR07DRAFT_1483116 [Suillus spraguei]|nr:hypothetical protein BDR07DRAFT_1483116 [Suillus spraguei]
MTSAVRASKLMPATAVVSMQGAINRIGDILDKAVNNAAPVSSSAPVPTPVPAPAPAPPPPPQSRQAVADLCKQRAHDGILRAEPTCSTMLIYKGPS